MIFEKMREEGFSNGVDDVRLTIEIMVPSSQVGRIIGRGGQNVRELQRITGSSIKLPDITANAAGAGNEEETTVHIIGTFIAVQVCIDTQSLVVHNYWMRVILSLSNDRNGFWT